MFKEFKEFLIKGNAIDMAVGFIFGAAFATVVKSVVENVIMPPIGMLMGNVDFSTLFINLGNNEYATLAEVDKAGAAAIKYGVVINDIIAFLILGFVVFLFIRSYNKMKEAAEETEKSCPECAMTIPVEAKKCGHCLVDL